MKRLLCGILLAVSIISTVAIGADSTKRDKARPIDGEAVYKTHCTRCHAAPPTLSERDLRVIARHMRVRANLLSTDYEAVLSYLQQNTKAKN
jgi:mono/diheme cytochrome c family protein